MAVRSMRQARLALQQLLQAARSPYSILLRSPDYLPPGFHTTDPTDVGRSWLWTEPPPAEVGGYGDPATYRLEDVVPDAQERARLWRAPGALVAEDDVTADGGHRAAESLVYRRHSVDLTMRGGTASGVVYPLAVCEIATRFRLRNVGGASAGAIAAAASAAAELGRSSQLPAPAYAPLPDAQRRQGHVRPGFVGLSDTIAWLAQVDPGPSDAAAGLEGALDEHRLAQLFRPAPDDRRVFSVLVAVLRQQLWAVPLTLVMALGRLWKLLVLLLTAAAVAATAWLGPYLPVRPHLTRPAHTSAAPWSVRGGWAVLDLLAFFALVGAGIVLVPLLVRFAALLPAAVRSLRGEPPDADPPWLRALRTVTSRHAPHVLRSSTTWRPVLAALVLVAVVLLLVAGWWHWIAATLVGSTLILLLAVVVVAALSRYLAGARAEHFGLIAGAAPATHRRPTEWMAGVVRPTVDRALVPWLTDCLDELAALPTGQVLRFGHLWLGRDFTPLPPRPPDGAPAADRSAWDEETALARAAWTDVQQRLVNLELVTTDLSRQRPYRFPLRPMPGAHGGEQLYFRMEDLEGAGGNDGDGANDGSGAAIFGPDVISAMADPAPQTFITEDGSGEVTLHRLPDPWNLPVIFAVRLSLSLPVLFKAVRLYRLLPSVTIRDDLGRAVWQGAQRLSWPPSGQWRAQELWFSDGGITSNFPVHFFDHPLPRWPTFGLNLGPHPYAFPHQDVWLPQDWQATVATARPFGGSLTGFLSSVFTTARSWHDTMQTVMPGYRGRVAWVRQRPDEGGTNLFMPREVIASMALRGALAGARLTRRFTNDQQWDRYRWVRLRVALDDFQGLRHDVRRSRPAYDDVLTGKDQWLHDVEEDFPYDPFTGEPAWFEPRSTDFWPAATSLLDDLSVATADDVLTQGAPVPRPDLRQVPPI